MIRYKPRGQYSGVMDEHKDGDFVLHTEAQAEIDALHAECDRLTAMLEPQKVLEADDVTGPGFYWHRLSKGRRWSVRSVWASGNPQRPLFIDHPEIFGELEGQFIGPLKAPEV